MNRIKKILEEFLLKSDVDAVIMSSDINRKYVVNMNSSAGTIVLTREKAYFIIDFRYIEKAKATIVDCEVILQSKVYEQIKEIFSKHNVKRVGIEDDVVSVAEFDSMQKSLEGFELVKGSGLYEYIKKIRQTKTSEEIKTIIEAQKITDKAFTEICNFIKKDVTEKQVAAYLEYVMKQNGADGLSFDTIAVGGVNSSLPHGEPSHYKLQEGDFLTMDFGAVVDGYHADMTRTVAIGEISDAQYKVYNTVLKAQLLALESIKIGAECGFIDKVAREYIYESGYKGCFGHSLGHSVGVEIHESPNFSPLDKTLVENGLVITVEPGIYLENKFGVRIEDMVVVQDNEVKNITNSKKELIIL